jgi:hypothetical protein
MIRSEWQIGWSGLIAILTIAILATTPLFHRFSRKSYILYTATALALLGAVLWWHDFKKNETLAVAVDKKLFTTINEYRFILSSGGGGLGLTWMQFRLDGSATEDIETSSAPSIVTIADSAGHSPYPIFAHRVLDIAGFRISWFRESPIANGVSKTLLALIFPNWSLILVTGFIPCLHLLTRRKKKRAFRRMNNLCEQCGYSLQGLPRSPEVRCPECGSARPPLPFL